MKPTTSPTAMPPSPTRKNWAAPWRTENVPVARAAIARRMATSAVASLTRLSPSRMTTIRRGIRRCSAMAVAEMASGGEMIAPSTNPAASGKSGNRKCAKYPTETVVNSTSPIARKQMGRKFARKSRQGVKIAAGYSSGGRKKRNTNSGLSRTGGIPGINARLKPPITSRIG